MAHKTRVGGTAYEIKGGKTRVGGTGYSIGKGKTRVGGTAYSISFGVTWAKYSCEATEVQFDYYEMPNHPSIGRESTTQNGVRSEHKMTVYEGYAFTKETGYFGTGAKSVYITSCVGYYRVVNSQVRRYVSVTFSHEDDTYKYYDVTTVGVAEASGGGTITQYNKGSTSYGKITVDENVLPEQGTLVSGSATENYCVIRINGTNYYYQKVA